jgi:hypothetical protein
MNIVALIQKQADKVIDASVKLKIGKTIKLLSHCNFELVQ